MKTKTTKTWSIEETRNYMSFITGHLYKSLKPPKIKSQLSLEKINISKKPSIKDRTVNRVPLKN